MILHRQIILIYSFLILLISLIILTGCGSKPCLPHKEFVTKEVYVPIRVELPKVECDFNANTADEVIDKMLECIKDQKKVIEIYGDSINEYNNKANK